MIRTIRIGFSFLEVKQDKTDKKQQKIAKFTHKAAKNQN